MTRGDSTGPGSAITPAPSVDAFLDAKLHRPASRADWLHRPRLLDQVETALDHSVTLIAAPAGYGKTILLTQWLAEVGVATAWISLDAGDNDPGRLWSHVTTAVERAGLPVGSNRSLRRRRHQNTAPGTVLPRLVEAFRASTEVIVLVLDDFHVIRDAACHRQVEFLIEHLPPGAHLVIVTRSDPGLRLGRLRASGALAEIRADELSFTLSEAEALFARGELHLTATSVNMLMDRTEGWPAGLYLASLSLAGRQHPDAFVSDFSGDNRYVGDYLTEEVLSRHPAEVREFIIRVSILERFSAALCDDVLGIDTSAAILRDLERTNLFVIPLDDEGRWYRFHPLFAAVAQAELEVSHPEDIGCMHQRAAAWFSRNGNVDESIKHSIAAGDRPAASHLVQKHWLQYVDAGRIATVQYWLHSAGSPEGPPEPATGVTAAWMAALTGDEAGLADRLIALKAFSGDGPLPDGSQSVESAVAMINGLFGYGGPSQMLHGAERAVALETDRSSPFYALAQIALGHAAYVVGDLDRSLPALSNVAHNDRAPVIARAWGLATESLVENERGNLGRGRECAEQAVELLDRHDLRTIGQASLVYTALGQAHAASGELDQALGTLELGLVLRRTTSSHGPWATNHHLLIHAQVAAEAGRPELAKELLADVDSRLRQYSDGMAAMRARLASARGHLRAQTNCTAPGEPLTGRETDILRLLQGSMSLHEIATELFVSFNTVKTHSRAVYRKLAVHTRAEAVAAGREQGLV